MESQQLIQKMEHPEILFGGTVSKCNVLTGETKNVSPERGGTPGQPGQFRHAWTQPLVFSQADSRALYFANQFLYKTTNGGESWTQISQDMGCCTSAVMITKRMTEK